MSVLIEFVPLGTDMSPCLVWSSQMLLDAAETPINQIKFIVKIIWIIRQHTSADFTWIFEKLWKK